MAQMQSLGSVLAALAFMLGAGAGAAGDAVTATAAELVSGDPGYGRQFVRTHPFTLATGVEFNIHDWTAPNASFADLGVNTVLTWRRDHQAGIAYAKQHGLNWMGYEDVEDIDPGQVENLSRKTTVLGFLVDDEPGFVAMDPIGRKIATLRTGGRDMLLMCNAMVGYGSAGQRYYGFGQTAGKPAVAYSYQQYLSDYLDIIEPDVLMYDQYPFRNDRPLEAMYFRNLMAVRAKAREANNPYWAWIQSFGQGRWRIPSESDIRMQVFSHLAAGYTGLSHFFYNSYEPVGRVGLVKQVNGEPAPTQTYPRVKRVNPEILHLGRVLRLLESTAVRFVPGLDAKDPGTHLGATPAGLSDFTPGAGGDPHIQAVSIVMDQAGDRKDGLIGLFTDPRGQHYFMLVNLYHGGSLTPQEAALDFEIRFDATVDQVLRLNRISGKPKVIDIPDDHSLELTLPGGTGDLFKYDTGDFPIGEPAARHDAP